MKLGTDIQSYDTDYTRLVHVYVTTTACIVLTPESCLTQPGVNEQEAWNIQSWIEVHTY